MFIRIVRFPLVLLLLEAAALIVLVAAYTKAASAAGIMDKGPLQFAGALVLAALIIGLWKLLRARLEADPDREFTFPRAGGELAAGFGIGFAVFSAVAGITALLGGFEVLGLRGLGLGLGGGALWSMLSLAVFSAVFEETLFRGILLRHLETLLGTGWALAISAAIFGGLHLMNPDATPFAAFAIAMEAGILLGAAYLLTRRLWLAVGLHAAWNFTQGWVFSVPVSGGPAPLGLLITRRVGPDWLTGGNFGLEASVIALIVATTAGAGMLVLARRRRGFIAPMWQRGQDAPALQDAA